MIIEEKKEYSITTRFTSTQYEQLTNYCARIGVSIGALLRSLVNEYFENVK